MKKILVIHGPNLTKLGEREPDIYGKTSLAELDEEIIRQSAEKGIEVRTFQSNSEGAIIDAIEEASEWADGIIINPAAYTHYSHAIADAIRASSLPVVEVHLSNIHAREDFRARSVTAKASMGVITGFGTRSYLLAIEALLNL
ncbi:MAG: type II 3-dehydroquinate dehydratase [Candidatus Glassbacteria bacterium]